MVGHESGIHMICPSHRISKLVVHPSPPRSMLEHTAKDGPEDASLKHAQSVCILRSKSSGSQQSVKLIICTIPLHNASPDFAADVVVRSNDRPEIAKLLSPPRDCRRQLIHCFPDCLSHRQAGTSSSSHCFSIQFLLLRV